MNLQEMSLQDALPVVLANEQGLITEVNASFQAVWGWSPEDVVGKPLTVLIPKSLHDAHHLGFSRFVREGKPRLLNRPLNLKTVAKDGRVLEAEHYIVAERKGDRWMFGATIQPVPAQTPVTP